MPWVLYPWDKYPWCHLKRVLSRSQSQSGLFGEEKALLLLLGIKP
jgi:hypothetical protein